MEWEARAEQQGSRWRGVAVRCSPRTPYPLAEKRRCIHALGHDNRAEALSCAAVMKNDLECSEPIMDLLNPIRLVDR